MLEIVLDRGDKWLEDFRLLELAQEPERAASDVLIRVAQVVAEIIAHEDHLWQQLAVGSGLLHHLPVHKE